MIKSLGEIIGHKRAVEKFKLAASSGRVSHAYLLAGPPAVGKETLALAFARALLCRQPLEGDSCGACLGCRQANDGVHPDLTVTGPSGATIKIEQVRLLQRETNSGPRTGKWAVNIITGADAMTPEAANCLLKTLEEPVLGTVFILVTAKPQLLLPTVVSRCQQIYLQPLSREELAEGLARSGVGGIGELPLALAGGSLGRALALADGSAAAERDRAENLARRLTGSGAGGALRLAEELSGGSSRGAGKAPDRRHMNNMLDLLLLWYRDIMLEKESAGGENTVNRDRAGDIKEMARFYTTGRIIEIINHIEQAKGALAAGANIRLTLESLFLKLSAGTGRGR
ncbi:DNA polymerase III delta prime subunit [Desulfocucumis palustris]|uniref:DNA polymerase III delta prime subunit n=1 Tax=Desulfocucumis palustris TaxID=1898651 RepID=A0A2L2XDE2_9FIRM|nr:DNA polymerase III subunit delta' [Desulfocucumis palustris]GBF34369.1 DNA polymerase III delta prime subunit [Desulfocucumis palustris]